MLARGSALIKEHTSGFGNTQYRHELDCVDQPWTSKCERSVGSGSVVDSHVKMVPIIAIYPCDDVQGL